MYVYVTKLKLKVHDSKLLRISESFPVVRLLFPSTTSMHLWLTSLIS